MVCSHFTINHFTFYNFYSTISKFLVLGILRVRWSKNYLREKSRCVSTFTNYKFNTTIILPPKRLCGIWSSSMCFLMQINFDLTRNWYPLDGWRNGFGRLANSRDTGFIVKITKWFHSLALSNEQLSRATGETFDYEKNANI